MKNSKNLVLDASRKDLAQLIGKTIGRLTAKEVVGYYTEGSVTRTAYRFECYCGNNYINTAKDIKRGHTLSCGCLRKDTTKKTGKKNKIKDIPSQSSFSRFYNQSVVSAKIRKKEFTLTESDFKSLVDSDCHYCGAKPSRLFTSKNRIPYVYNGIDRKNNSVGYLLENCLPCCTMCNFAKRDSEYETFIEWAKQLGTYQLSLNI